MMTIQSQINKALVSVNNTEQSKTTTKPEYNMPKFVIYDSREGVRYDYDDIKQVKEEYVYCDTDGDAGFQHQQDQVLPNTFGGGRRRKRLRPYYKHDSGYFIILKLNSSKSKYELIK